jgi:hypothetical protein
MKSYRLALAAIFFLCISSFSLSAQDDREDVVYLKNGSIYRGTIIEQVPGVSLKIETTGGNVFFVVIADVMKFTKEKKVVPDADDIHHGEMRGEGYYHDEMYNEHYGHYHHAMSDSIHRVEFHPRKKGYFNTLQLLIENLEGGGRMVNGYKFGRLGYLGIGIGADFIFNDMRKNNADYGGVYLPLYIHYGGDILKKRITPFYSIEAGYAMRLNPGNNRNFFSGGDLFNNNPNITNRKGGMMGGIGLGLKFNSRHKVFFSISAHADFQQAENTYNNYGYYPNGGYYTYTTKSHTMLMIPGIRLGLGF